jgi:hypothetical protein
MSLSHLAVPLVKLSVWKMNQTTPLYAPADARYPYASPPAHSRATELPTGIPFGLHSEFVPFDALA